ncbi:MAG TPA: hypothetical protein VF950_23130 [Planctomycetota bacterium]
MICLFICGVLAGDVVVLKDGAKVSGRVVDKTGHYEVTTETGLRTFLKEEVDKILKDPKELLGDSDRLFEEAKKEFEAALTLGPAEQNGAVKAAIAKVTSARETIAATRELFPEDKHAALDVKLMQVMQLMRLLRDRLGSEIARRPGSGPAMVNAKSSMAMEEAVGILSDPLKRADAGRRQAARDAFSQMRQTHPEVHELATAALLYLSKSDQEWRMEGAALKALQEYFAKSWIQSPLKLAPANHQEAATWLAAQIAAVRKADAKAETEPLALFGIGHLGHAPGGAESDQTARLLGLAVRNGIAGTPEGHAVRDMNAWIASGDFDLAALSFVKEHRSSDTPVVRFVWSYALLRLAQAKKRGFERPVQALQSIKTGPAIFLDHVGALVKSIKAVAVCGTCSGEAKLRCVNCHGKKEIRFNCEKCKGKGKIPEAGGGYGFRDNEIPCYPCRGRGYSKLFTCEKCKDGYLDCKQCEKPGTAPDLDQIYAAGDGCGSCDGRGFVFKRILWACKTCMGVGQKLAPRVDPARVLP